MAKPLKLFAIWLSPEWAEIREAADEPKFKSTVRYVMAEERIIKTVRTRRRDWDDFPIYEDREVVKTKKYPLRNTGYVGGTVLFPISVKEYNKLAIRYRTSAINSDNPVVEISPKLEEKLRNKEWRLKMLTSTII